jgi:hypothetical protein
MCVQLATPLTLSSYDVASATALVDLGAVLVQVSGFGDELLSPNLDMIEWSTSYLVSKPVPLLVISRSDQLSNNKVDMLIELIRRRWRLTAVLDAEFTIVSEQRLYFKCLYRPASMFQALLDANTIIVVKGAGKIMLLQCDAYYKCLIQLQQLSRFHHMANFERMRNKHFESILKGRPMPLFDIAEVPAVIEVDVEEEDIALPVLGGDPIPRHLDVGVVVGAPVFLLAAVTFADGFVVNFDNLSHQSGERRALSMCRQDHPRCRRDVFVKNHLGDKVRAAAWLAAWESHVCPSRDAHMLFVPSDADVDRMILNVRGA